MWTSCLRSIPYPHSINHSYKWLIINWNTQDLPFNWGPSGIQVFPAVLTCLKGILSCIRIVHTCSFLLYFETHASYLHYLSWRFYESLIPFQSLKKSSDLITISLHPNSWVVHTTCPREAKLVTPIHLTSINQSFSSHALETFVLDRLHLNIHSKNQYISYDL
jgi:hypothetical protein